MTTATTTTNLQAAIQATQHNAVIGHAAAGNTWFESVYQTGTHLDICVTHILTIP